MSELYVDHLRKVLGKNARHEVGHALDIVPFLTKRTRRIRGNFNNVLGEFVRRVCNLELDLSALDSPEYTYFPDEDNNKDENLENLIWYFADKIKTNNEDEQFDLIRFLKEYLFNKDEIKIIHPFMFNYIQVNKKDKNEFSKYGRFMCDVLVKDKARFQEVFNDDQTTDILTQLIVNQKDILVEGNIEAREYDSLLSPITTLYEEDIFYLSKHKEYFLDSFGLLTHFYVFMYVCQLMIKFESFTKANYDSLEPLYYSLEWEKLSRRRRAVDDLNSLKGIFSIQSKFFSHIHALSQLSHNKTNIKESELDTKRKIRVQTYPQIKRLIEEGELDEEKFTNDLRNWMRKYTSIFQKEFKDSYEPRFENLDDGFKEMFELVNRGTNAQVREKFGKNLEDLGADEFIKSRGNLGRVFNITHQFFLLLTAVCVKDERIPVNKLFDEYEKRGIRLDRQSKAEAVYTLDKLNLIDKKSDSGDAQYVKPVL